MRLTCLHSPWGLMYSLEFERHACNPLSFKMNYIFCHTRKFVYPWNEIENIFWSGRFIKCCVILLYCVLKKALLSLSFICHTNYTVLFQKSITQGISQTYIILREKVIVSNLCCQEVGPLLSALVHVLFTYFS